MEILIKKYKENSRIPIEQIKRQQYMHRKDLIQPRDGNGEINQEYVHQYGTKNLRVTEHDIRRMERKNSRFAKELTKKYKDEHFA